ncbi:MAG: hypothetical protein J2P57_10160 [Acidimicrobiaceae bacterium]|nr:hypothetical protein [Acidimicrobiaceae bacterium]
MRVPDGHFFVEDDGNVIDAGRTLEVAAPAGRRLAEHGYELVNIREVRPGD